jgi:hypothetical protein
VLEEEEEEEEKEKKEDEKKEEENTIQNSWNVTADGTHVYHWALRG